jgi:hypothetical protein
VPERQEDFRSLPGQDEQDPGIYLIPSAQDVSAEDTTRKDVSITALQDYIEKEREIFAEEADYEHLKRLEGLLGFYQNEVFPIISDIEKINARLTSRSRADLVIYAQASVKQISHPEDMLGNDTIDDHELNEGNNFIEKLILKNSPEGHIPVAAEEYDAWRKGYYEFAGNNHTQKKAFERADTLFPDFIRAFILDLNQKPKEERNMLEAEAYVLYQIMSRLVDKSDEFVSTDDGGIKMAYSRT